MAAVKKTVAANKEKEEYFVVTAYRDDDTFGEGPFTKAKALTVAKKHLHRDTTVYLCKAEAVITGKVKPTQDFQVIEV